MLRERGFGCEFGRGLGENLLGLGLRGFFLGLGLC